MTPGPTDGTGHFTTAGLAAIALWLAMLGTASAASTDVYRCMTPDGNIEFQQGPCAGAADQSEVTLDDRPTGWVPPDPPRTRTDSKAKAHKETSRSRSAPKRAKPDERACWEKRQRLDDVEARLRHGYKAKQGMELKRKQESYEDYLHRFCR